LLALAARDCGCGRRGLASRAREAAIAINGAEDDAEQPASILLLRIYDLFG
jgi:hypothetical protein